MMPHEVRWLAGPLVLSGLAISNSWGVTTDLSVTSADFNNRKRKNPASQGYGLEMAFAGAGALLSPICERVGGSWVPQQAAGKDGV